MSITKIILVVVLVGIWLLLTSFFPIAYPFCNEYYTQDVCSYEFELAVKHRSFFNPENNVDLFFPATKSGHFCHGTIVHDSVMEGNIINFTIKGISFSNYGRLFPYKITGFYDPFHHAQPQYDGRYNVTISYCNNTIHEQIIVDGTRISKVVD